MFYEADVSGIWVLLGHCEVGDFEIAWHLDSA